MNEYQQRNEDRYSADAERVVILVDELNKLDSESWAVVPRSPNQDHAPTRHKIKTESGLEIICNHNGYGLECRWRFSACGWPSYQDADGNEKSIDTSYLSRPQPAQPTTTAADTRTYGAITKQIMSKLVTPYRSIFAQCITIASDHQRYACGEAIALRALTEAFGGVYKQGKGHNRHLRVAVNADHDYISGEFHSSGHVTLSLTAEQAVTALGAIL